MALFIVRHEHAAERYPVADPQMGAMLLNHLIKREAVRSRDPGEAIVQGEHTLYLIAKGHDESGEPECPWRKFRIGLVYSRRGGRSCLGVRMAEPWRATQGRTVSSAAFRLILLGHPDLLLAYAINGEPLPIEHGYPVRLIVPRLVRCGFREGV